MNRLKSKSLRLVLSFLIILGVVGGAMALTSANSTRTNVVTIGHIKLALKEEQWDRENRNNAIPGKTNEDGTPVYIKENLDKGQIFAKDPKLENIGNKPLYAYISLSIPVVEINGNRTELFEFDINPNWHSFNVDTSNAILPAETRANANVYYFYYDQVLSPNTETSVLLKDGQLKVKDISNYDYQGLDNLEILVVGYGAQSVNTDEANGDIGNTLSIKESWDELSAKYANLSLPSISTLS